MLAKATLLTLLLVANPLDATDNPCSQKGGRIDSCSFLEVSDTGFIRLRASADVLNPSFTELANGMGQFKGFISGLGTVHLNLLFFEGEKLISRKYMGHVQISRGEKRVPFNFQTPIPRGRALKWRILASSHS